MLYQPEVDPGMCRDEVAADLHPENRTDFRGSHQDLRYYSLLLARRGFDPHHGYDILKNLEVYVCQRIVGEKEEVNG